MISKIEGGGGYPSEQVYEVEIEGVVAQQSRFLHVAVAGAPAPIGMTSGEWMNQSQLQGRHQDSTAKSEAAGRSARSTRAGWLR